MFADKWGVSPFEVFEKDIDDFILLTKQLIKKGKNQKPKEEGSAKNNKELRIKVNDKTATGGWW